MSLNSEVAAFLDLVEDSQSSAFHQGTPEQARAAFEQSSQQMRWDVPDVDVTEVQYIARDGAELTLRLYRPLQKVGVLPVLLFLHGGGFVVGSLDSHDGICREFCARTPCAVLSVGYRRAPEHRFPVALHDCADALDWLREHAGAFDLDLSRLVFGGDSVGATLATVLALEARAADALKPCLQLLCYPVTDASQRRESMDLLGEGYLLESDTLEWFYQHYARSIEDRHDWRFSPLLCPDLAGAAPAYVALAGFDPLVDEGRAYAERLDGTGGLLECREFPGHVHDFLRMRMVTEEVEAIYQELVTVLRAAMYPADIAD
ncbi:alpha/beta hydrolase [Pseudomonas sp. NPDC087346]|uniref:alpha/beta hydrolase n=1 Tax=Pseudomonas sp. NPDC087346 TaxID=3364438 RepID=UPI0037F20885